MTVEGEAELVALALVRIDLAVTADGRPRHAEGNQLLEDLSERYGSEGLLALLAVLVHLQARACTVVAGIRGQTVGEFMDDFEAQEFLARAGEH
jgi:hypothetical protein